MQWLVRLVCPKGATVLDPFAGTGTTGEAAFRESCKAVLIEREAEYLADIERRMGMLLSGPDERSRKLTKPDPHETLPLFA
jgi:DNA modification methylase